MSGEVIDGAATIGNGEGGVIIADLPFDVDAATPAHYFSANAHRRIVQSLSIANRSWRGNASTLRVTVRTESASGLDYLHPCVVEIPSFGPGDSNLLTSLPLRPNYGALAQAEEAEQGYVVVDLHADDVLVGRARNPIEFLAYDQYVYGLSYNESLAAFVLERHPSVTAILTRVRERLGATTGSTSTEGYQQGPERVIEILRAVWDEISALGFDYSNPPGGLEGYGQKIRTPDRIESERAATCLDSTVLFASVILGCGLRPVMSLIQGHAFVACYLINPDQLRRQGLVLPGVIDNANIADDLIAQKILLPIETTKAARGGSGFEAAVATAISTCQQWGSAFEALVDVAEVVRRGVRTIPMRRLVDGQLVVELVIDPLSPPVDPVGELGDPVVGPADAGSRLDLMRMPRRVRRWLDGLLDISRSNPLVNLRAIEVGPTSQRTAKGIRLPVPESMVSRIEDKVMSGKPIRLVVPTHLAGQLLEEPSDKRVVDLFDAESLVPVIDPNWLSNQIERAAREEHENTGRGLIAARLGFLDLADRQFTDAADRAFKSLKKLAEDVEQQSATNQLYLCIGTLVWNEPAQPGRAAAPDPMRSPIYIVPVRMTGSARTEITVTLDEGGEITPNYCLLEKLRSELQLSIPELEQPVLDDSGINVDNAFSAIRQSLGAGRHTDIRVEPSVTLAVLDFASFRTWRDLRDNWETFMRNDVVRHLVETPHQSFENAPEPVNGDLLCPIACDESQLEAVRWAAEGRSFVLEGPPGTGKSQTIANLIAASMALGKRVLFVAEKQVALEVVSRRLAAIGLDPFCIVIHHESVTPDGIRMQLQKSLDFEGTDRVEEWNTAQAVSEAIVRQLGDYRDRLVGENAVGHSLWKAHQEVIRLGAPQRITLTPASLVRLAPFQRAIEQSLLELQPTVGASHVDPRHPWQLSNLATCDGLDFEALSRSVAALAESVSATQSLSELLDAILGDPSAAGDAASTAAALAVAATVKPGELSRLEQAADPAWIETVRRLAARCERLRNEHADVVGYFKPIAYRADVNAHMAAAVAAVGAGLFGRKKKISLLAALVDPISTRSESDPKVVLGLLQGLQSVSSEVVDIVSGLRNVVGLDAPETLAPTEAQQVHSLVEAAEALARRASALFAPAAEPVRRMLERGQQIGTNDSASVESLLARWSDFASLVGASDTSVSRWLAGRSLHEALRDAAPNWNLDSPQFLGLQRWAAINRLLEPLRSGGLDELAERIVAGSETLEGLHEEFLRARAAGSRDERILANGLTQFDRVAHTTTVERLVRADAERKQLMRHVIPRQLVERRPFRPRIRMGDVGRLEAELGRKVRRVSLPRLIRDYGETVTHLTPCFLMSPDAVARLLPAEKQFFDIVVFDEASQVKVANAIPAMGRAKSVVVVGDSQQMPPSKRIGTRTAETANREEEADDDEVIVADLESILSECRESNLPALMLKCHFRSRHEGLIAFSNQHFYGSSLVTFPAPDTETASPITWHQVDGQFIQQNSKAGPNADVQTNDVEANAIVAEVQRRLHDPLLSSKSIGIVTLNEKQRNKILGKLSELGDPAVDAALSHKDPELRLFVNALEQVQGDERDVIIMSIAFSYQYRDEGGRQVRRLPLNFGPLINQGGERRLNVAVTRAKEEMVVYCSFNPDDLDLRNSTSVGLERLKDFLQMVRQASTGHNAALRAREPMDRDHYRRMLADSLRAADISVREEVGLSKFRIDLAVATGAREGQFLAILLDGPAWADRSTAYDRDVLPDAVLRSIGWRRVGRVWLPAAVLEPDHVISTVRAEVDRERHRLDLRAALADRGFEIREDQRLNALAIDFTIRRPGQSRWLLAVRLNGPGLFPQAVPFVGELPSGEQLEQVEVWAAHRVWIPDLVTDREAQLALIDDAVAAAERSAVEWEAESQAGASGATDPAGDPGRSGDPTSRASAAPSQGVQPAAGTLVAHSLVAVPFVSAEALGVVGTQEVLDSAARHDIAKVSAAIQEILQVEAPIAEGRLAKLVAARFGMKAVRDTRLTTMRQRFFRLLATTDVGLGVFIWRDAAQAAEWRGYRTSDEGSGRDVLQIAPEEILNAMVDVVNIGHSAYEDELIRQVATVFGRKSITAQLRERLESVLEWGIKSGRLAVEVGQSGDRRFVPPTSAS